MASFYYWIFIVSSVLLFLVYPAVLIASVMGLANKSSSSIFTAFYGITIAYPLFYAIGCYGYYSENYLFCFAPYGAIGLSFVLFSIGRYIENSRK